MSRSFCVIYSEDAQPWSEFLRTLVLKERSIRYEYRTRIITELFENTDSSKQLEVETADVLLVILSPGLTSVLKGNQGYDLKGVVSGGQKGALFFCGLNVEDLEEVDTSAGGKRDLKSRFPCYENWAKVLHTDANNLMDVIEETKTLSDVTYNLIPTCARCEGNSTVTVSFSDVMKEANPVGHLLISSDDVDDYAEEKINLTWVNDKTAYFKAPCRKEGNVGIQVFISGKQILGTKTLTYESNSEMISGIMQLYIHAMNQLIKLILTKSSISKLNLDDLLHDAFTDDETKNIWTKSFEELLGIYRHSRKSQKTQVELPTLLHLTRKFGLKKFQSWLEGLPDASTAASILNIDGLPAEEVKAFLSTSGSVPPFPVLGSQTDSIAEEAEEDDDETYLIMDKTLLQKGAADDPYKSSGASFTVMSWKNNKAVENLYSGSNTERTDGNINEDDDDDDDDCYEIFEGEEEEAEPEQEVKQEPQPAPNTTAAAANTAAAVPGTGQQELIEIMHLVKTGDLTIDEAHILYEEWKISHRRPSYCAAQPLTPLMKKSSSSAVMSTPPKPSTPEYGQSGQYGQRMRPSPSLPELPALPARGVRNRCSDSSDKHSSTTSTSSYDSIRSSTTGSPALSSGIEVDPIDDDLATSSPRNSGCSTDGSSSSGFAPPPLPARPGMMQNRKLPPVNQSKGGKRDADKVEPKNDRPRPPPPRR